MRYLLRVFVRRIEDVAVVVTVDHALLHGYRTVDVIPFKVWGLVYAPDGPIEIANLRSGDRYWMVSGCEPVDGPWWWCRVY